MKLNSTSQASASNHLFEGSTLSLLKPRFAFESDDGTAATGTIVTPPNKPEAVSEPAPAIAPDEPLRAEGKKALDEERAAKRQLEKQLQRYKGIDPDKYQELLELQASQQKEAETRQRQELESKQKYEEALKLKEESFGKEKLSYQEQVKTLETQLKQQSQLIAQKEILREFTIALDANEGYTEDAKTLLKDDAIQPYLKYDADADAVIVINPTTGDRLTKNGEFVELKDWVATWKPSKLRFFKPSNTNSGGGTNPTKPRAIGNAEPVSDLKGVKFEDLMNRARSKAK